MTYTNTGKTPRMSAGTVTMQARAHLSARYDLLAAKLLEFSDEITRARYIAANLDASRANIRAGLVPDGEGSYLTPTDIARRGQ